MGRLTALFFVVIAVIAFELSSSDSQALRESRFQLTEGAVSVDAHDEEKVRVRRQEYGRNPPAPNYAVDSYPQVPVAPAVQARPFQQPRFQNHNQQPQQYQNGPPRFQNNVNPPRGQGRRGGGPRANVLISDAKATRYYYPPRMPLPLPTCFHNPTGYICCNKHLNDLIVDTYTELEARPKFHTCNINAIAHQLQLKAEKRFNTSFETIASFEDFAQKIHFNGDLACKVEIGGKYMLAYGTVHDVDEKLVGDQTIGPENQVPPHHISRRHSMFI